MRLPPCARTDHTKVIALFLESLYMEIQWGDLKCCMDRMPIEKQKRKNTRRHTVFAAQPRRGRPGAAGSQAQDAGRAGAAAAPPRRASSRPGIWDGLAAPAGRGCAWAGGLPPPALPAAAAADNTVNCLMVLPPEEPCGQLIKI